MTAGGVLKAVQVLSGIAVTLSSLEYFSLRREFAPAGFFASCGRLMNHMPALMLVRVVLGLFLASGLSSGYDRAALLVCLCAAVLVSNRAIVFGLEAADQMISIVLFAQMLASFTPESLSVQRTCLWFIAIQASMAYTVAGWSKLLKPAWRDGSYLLALMKTEVYGHSGLAQMLSQGSIAKWLSRTLIILEAAFPAALLTGVPGCVFFVICMFAMHLTNALFLGLNLFVWSFLATYPALIYCAASLYQ